MIAFLGKFVKMPFSESSKEFVDQVFWKTSAIGRNSKGEPREFFFFKILQSKNERGDVSPEDLKFVQGSFEYLQQLRPSGFKQENHFG